MYLLLILCFWCFRIYFFLNDTATTEIYTYRHTLSLHDALPISPPSRPAPPKSSSFVSSAQLRPLNSAVVPPGPLGPPLRQPASTAGSQPSRQAMRRGFKEPQL